MIIKKSLTIAVPCVQVTFTEQEYEDLLTAIQDAIIFHNFYIQALIEEKYQLLLNQLKGI